MSEYTLPDRCDRCPFFIQTFIQELKRKTPEGLRTVPVLTGICGVMRLSEIRATVPAYETTHRRSGDAACYFSDEAHSGLAPKVSWLIEKQKALKAVR